jgi:hypothetical protein
VHGARDLASAKPGLNLEPFRSWDTKHCVGKHCFQLVEDGLTQANWAVADHAGDGAADAVFGVAKALDDFLHACRGISVGAADGDKRVDLFARDGRDEGEEGGVGGECRMRWCWGKRCSGPTDET